MDTLHIRPAYIRFIHFHICILQMNIAIGSLNITILVHALINRLLSFLHYSPDPPAFVFLLRKRSLPYEGQAASLLRKEVSTKRRGIQAHAWI